MGRSKLTGWVDWWTLAVELRIRTIEAISNARCAMQEQRRGHEGRQNLHVEVEANV